MPYQLRKLKKTDETKFLSYVDAWKNERMVPNSAVLKEMSFDAYLSMLSLREQGLYQPDVYVPDLTLVMVDDQDQILGVTNIRLKLNEHLFLYDGHIGYGIHPKFRNQGLGIEILRLSLLECKNYHIHEVMVSCNEENIASKKVIEANGGLFENKVFKTDGYILRYWFHIKGDKQHEFLYQK